MATFNVTGTAVNAAGSVPFTGTITTVDLPVIQSVVIVPQSAPPGTLRTITITATGATSYTCLVAGVPATATAQPNVFTVII
jgi:hypothetical protein